jgi:hypothetical protein
MELVLAHLVDADQASLETRLARALRCVEPGCVVLRFTHWYTGRPRVYEAVVARAAQAAEAA